MRPHVVHWLSHHVRGDVASLLAPSWFTCVGLAGLAALLGMLVLARRRGIDTGAIASVVVWCHVAAVLAGILVPMAIDGAWHLVATGHLQLRWSGMTSFWGYLAGGAAVALVCRREGLPLARVGDLSVIPLGVALAFARLGCFMAGCDYGKVTSLPWAVRFPAGSPAWRDHVAGGLISAERAESLPVHPTELYEALLGLVIVGMAVVVSGRARRSGRSRHEGELFLLAAATYAIGRLAIEALRGDAGRGIYAGLSSGQIFSLLVLLAIGARLFVVKRRMLTAAAAAALALTVAQAGEAQAQPGQPADPAATADSEQPASTPQPADPAATADSEQPASAPQPADPAATADSEQPASTPPPAELPPPVDEVAPPAPDPTERPLFSTGLLLGVATPLNRRANQVSSLGGASLSIGYLPGRFGLWLDVDALSSAEASHDTILASVSYSRRPIPGLMLGVRAGVGLTLVNFKDPAFRDASGKSVRLEAVAEYAFLRHWALWARPLSIDMLDVPELGGPITMYQVRIGVAYRFGSRRNAVRPPDPPLPALGAVP
ncbi:MAG TPA: prolipoprotein diacylglyceryl transferase family protein [Kofleriaceae bacterium]|nr:prolipoprotein diacylglyceryl transferase family protein [Kofleriaceae bacterium]